MDTKSDTLLITWKTLLMNRKIVVGVWKDKLTLSESVRQAGELSGMFNNEQLGFDACIAPAPIALASVKNATLDSSIQAIAQDVHWPDTSRSYIGSTSIPMLKELDVRICMVGHSERRRFFGETDEDIHKKLVALISKGIFPILAIGDAEDSLEERRRVLKGQLVGGLGLGGEHPVDLCQLAIAYEPVWAISTWRSDRALPTGKEVVEMLGLVRDLLSQLCDVDPTHVPILFGGSVSPENGEDYFAQEDVDGALVGGASLTVESMSSVFRMAQAAWPVP
jgi:triosephosphate isomerase